MSKIRLFDNGFCCKDKITKCMTLVLILFSSFCFAQTVQHYDFSQTHGVYNELENPTMLAEATSTAGLWNTRYDVSIPFSFPFNGENFSTLKVHSYGFLTFGTDAPYGYVPISSSNIGYEGYKGAIAPFAGSITAYNFSENDKGGISYKFEGEAPFRKLIIQWKNYSYFYYNNLPSSVPQNAYKLNFQVHLHENGQVNFVYDLLKTGTATPSPSSFSTQIGMRGLTNSDYTNRYTTGSSTTENLANTTIGSSNSSVSYVYANFLPSSGLTFTWAPPASCVAPTAQPTNLELTNTGIIINGSYTASNPVSDKYLILRNIQGETSNIPVDGTTYTVGQNSDLNAYVVHYGTNTSFENNYNNGAIRGNNTYTYTIYSVSSNCTGGPLYLVDNPLTETVTNCPISLNGITATSPTTDSFILNWPLGENGNALPMSRVIEVATDENFTNMVTGSPFMLSASDLTLTINGLNPNTRYFFRGKNTTSYCESAFSSTGNIYTSCLAVTDFYENFDGVTGNVLPNCWSKITVGVTSSVPTVNVTTTYANSAPNGVTFYGSGADMTDLNNKAILVSPQLTNVGSGTHRLRFNAKMSSSGGTYDLQAVALSSNTADATIELIGTVTASQLTPNYQEFSINFNNYSGTANYVGIRRINGSSYSYLCVDDVIWEAIPSCPELQSISASNSTVDGATISWEDSMGTPTNGYEYFVSLTNSLPTESETLETTTDSSIIITDLSNGTYYVFVRRACEEDDKSPWRQTTFSTIPTAPAPWLEEFGNTTPVGWTTTGWSLGTSAAYPGNPGMNLHKNLWGTGSYSSGTFTTIPVGPLNSDNYEFSFDYKQGDYYSPYSPFETWGNIIIEVSDDFGNTWSQIGMIEDEQGTTGVYINKSYSLESYEGKYVKVRITANRTFGDYYLSFDNFEIKELEAEDLFCLPTFEYSADSNMITQVIFNTIDKTSPFTSGTTPQYEDFSDISTDVEQGSTHQISVKGPSSTFPSDVMVYIDFNQNGDFSDDGEGFYIGRIQPANPANAFTITSDIVIPNDALTGTTKMRIVKNTNVNGLSNPNADNSISGPCADNLRSGQVEEYSLNITEAVNVEVQSVEISTLDNQEPTITEEEGTLQLVAVINPTEANQDVVWTIVSGSEFASIDENGLITAISNGTTTVRATSVEDETKFDEFDIVINIVSQPEDYCIPEFFYPSSQAGVQISKISLAGETITLNVDPIVYDESGYVNYTDLPSADLISGNSYDLSFYTDWQDPHYINVRAWIDYNQNNQFDEEEEIGYYNNGIDTSGNGNFNFIVPENTPLGIYRLRVVLQFPNSQPNNLTPCGTINSYGIAIDYNLQVIEEVPSEDDYCEVSVEWDVEPITLVNFSDLNNPTDTDMSPLAYEDFTSMIANVNKGTTYTMAVKGFTGNFEHDIRVFIDWNQDLEFDMTSEYYTATLMPSTGIDEVQATIQITIPSDALLGNTRMRITKDHWTIYEEGEFDACTDAYYGQIQDYTVNVLEATSSIGEQDFSDIKIYPNPTTGIVNIESVQEVAEVKVFDMTGKQIEVQKFNSVDISRFSSGVYFFQIKFKNDTVLTKKVIKQ